MRTLNDTNFSRSHNTRKQPNQTPTPILINDSKRLRCASHAPSSHPLNMRFLAHILRHVRKELHGRNASLSYRAGYAVTVQSFHIPRFNQNVAEFRRLLTQHHASRHYNDHLSRLVYRIGHEWRCLNSSCSNCRAARRQVVVQRSRVQHRGYAEV